MNSNHTQHDLHAPRYIGDGVYVRYDGYHMVIFTSNGMNTSEDIFIDSGVFEELKKFAIECKLREGDDL